MKRFFWTAGALALMLLSGCIMDLPSGVRVDRPRVLGVRIEVTDPALAQPAPGEETTLAWLTVPGDAGWTYALTACVGQPSNQGIPSCASEPFAIGAELAPSPSPRFTFTVPEDARGSILIAGVLCEGGVPTSPPEGELLPGCDGEGAVRELVTFSFGVATETPPNRHPVWTDDALTVDGDPWPAMPGAACADLPQLARVLPTEEEESPSIEIGYATRAEDRERFDALVLGDPPSIQARDEELTITHVATAGRFVRLKSEVFDDDSATGSVPWVFPDAEELETIPPGGTVVTFWLVLRDGRGGMAITERALCLTP